jgi:hypothetical protein
MKYAYPLIIITLVIFLSGCKVEIKDLAVEKCINECRVQLEKGADLGAGPCLSNEIAPDWVCDVAHSPREPIDSQPENQCPAFIEQKAHHFVEVDTSCNLIKAY